MRSSKLHRLLSITKLNAFQHRLCVSDDNLPSRQHHFECFEFNMKRSNVLSDKRNIFPHSPGRPIAFLPSMSFSIFLCAMRLVYAIQMLKHNPAATLPRP